MEGVYGGCFDNFKKKTEKNRPPSACSKQRDRSGATILKNARI